MTALVTRIDHVYAVLEDAEEAHRFLHEDVGLPVAWPFESYGTFASGGIGLGNLNLEFIGRAQFFPAHQPARITGIAFAPARGADEQFLAELDAAGIVRSPLMPGPDWTNVLLLETGGDGVLAFVCDYRSPEPRDESLRRQQLRSAGGGKLGVVQTREVVVGTRQLSTAVERWQRLLAPVEPDDELRWRLGWGPDLRLVDHDRDEVIDLVLEADPEASHKWAELGGQDRLSGLPVSFEPPA